MKKQKQKPIAKPIARTVIQQKADKARAAWTTAMHAGVVKNFPPLAELEAGTVKSLGSFEKIDELQRMLADLDVRVHLANQSYEGFRRDGIAKLSDYAVTNTTVAKALTEALEDAREIVVKHRGEIASIKIRLGQLQGGLLAPVFKALPAPPTVIAKPTVENAKDIQWLPMARDVLEACVLVAPKDDARQNLNGVFIQAEKQAIRAVATNGHCLLLHSTPMGVDDKLPGWLEAGVILPREGLALALATVAKLKDEADETPVVLMVGYAKGHAHAIIKDSEEQVTFRMRVADGKFPEYRKLIEDAAAVLEGGERAPMSATSLDGTYVKQAAAIGAKFESKGITPFAGTNDKSPVVITFLGVPNALYIIAPLGTTSAEQLPSATMALMGKGLLGTLAALKATQTRQKKAMADSKSESEKKQMAAVIAERDQRIAAVVQAMHGKALEAPKSAAPTSTDAITSAIVSTLKGVGSNAIN
jgi:hypothetical protein